MKNDQPARPFIAGTKLKQS